MPNALHRMCILPGGLSTSASEVTSSKGARSYWWYVSSWHLGITRSQTSQTHNVGMASPLADFVVSLGSNGQVVSEGSVSDALAKNSELAEELKHVEEAIELDKDEDAEQAEAVVEDNSGKLVVAEEIEEGHVSREACELIIVFGQLTC